MLMRLSAKPAAMSAETPRAAPAKSGNVPVTILCIGRRTENGDDCQASVIPNAPGTVARVVGPSRFPLSEKP